MRFWFVFSLIFMLCMEAFAQKKHKPTDCVGMMAGKCITFQEFEQAVQKELTNSRISIETARTIVWNKYLYELVFEPELKEVGISLTKQQQQDLLWGDSTQVHSTVLESFYDHRKMRFDTEKRNELRADMQKNKDLQMRVEIYLDGLVKDKLRTAYENLITNSTYVTKAEAQRTLEDKSIKAHVRYLFVPYAQIPDSMVAPTEDELSKKLQANPKAYPVYNTVVLNYITLPINPTKADTSAFMQRLQDVMREWKLAEDPFMYASKRNENEYELKSSPFKSVRELPFEFFRKYPKPYRGGFFGPFLDGKKYVILYFHDTRQDSTQSNVRASHIFFKADKDEDEETKAKARKRAEEVLAQIKAGANFAEMAKKHGGDGTASVGGDLGWFGKGMMVKSFEEAIFGAKSEGLLPDLVTTDFGYHIVEVTSLPTDRIYQVATIERKLEVSQQTKDEVKTRLDSIARAVKTLQDLQDFVKKNPKYVLETQKLDEFTPRANGFEMAQMRPHAFSASEGELLPIGEVEDYKGNKHLILAGVEMITKEDEITVKAVREQLTTDVSKEKKITYILSKVDLQAKNLEEMAKQSGLVTQIKEDKTLSLDRKGFEEDAQPKIIFNKEKTPAHILPILLQFEKELREGYSGHEPVAIGTALGLAEGQRSRAIAGENGVFVIEKIAALPAHSPDEEAIIQEKAEIEAGRQSISSYHVQEAIKKLKKVKDYRYKFY